MNSNNSVIEAVRNIDSAFDEFKKHNDERVDSLLGRIEAVEAGASRPKGVATRQENEHKAAFLDWIRNPHDGNAKRRLDEVQAATLEGKDVLIGDAASGGYALPEVLQNEIERRVVQLNPFRRLCKVVRVGSSDYKHLVSKNQAGSGWVGETDTRDPTGTSDLVERAPTFGTIYAYPKASEEAFQDVFFNVADWLTTEVADAFSAAEATAFVSGNGTSKPTGFLNATPVTTADSASPERAAAALQYLPLEGASPIAINGDDLIDLANSLQDGYLMDESAIAWVMRRSTLTLIRKLKDTTGQYLWQPSLQAGEPSTLLGFPVVTTDAMPVFGTDNHPIAFGNWRRGYLIADRSDVRITVDDNVTTPGYVKFYVRKRLGGCVLNHQTLRLLKVSDS